MKTKIKITAFALAALCIAGGYPTCKCPNAGEDMKWQLDQLLRVKRWEVVTNVFLHQPPQPFPGSLVYIEPVLMTNYVTNAIIGNARVDLFKAEAIR